ERISALELDHECRLSAYVSKSKRAQRAYDRNIFALALHAARPRADSRGVSASPARGTQVRFARSAENADPARRGAHAEILPPQRRAGTRARGVNTISYASFRWKTRPFEEAVEQGWHHRRRRYGSARQFAKVPRVGQRCR